ncbi:hypothetical protein NC652_012491 [Populus alba x Populus x berolinensis]|nr:hypothetical protein NC652_012491 [Populus alba x Populus x berolinensis]
MQGPNISKARLEYWTSLEPGLPFQIQKGHSLSSEWTGATVPGSIGGVFCRGHGKNNHNLAGTHHHRHLATTTPLANNQQHPSQI